MARNDAKCRRCGKERPALSDCGGFYDLVPQAAPQPASTPASRPQKKAGPFAALCVFLALALAICVFFSVKLLGEKQKLAEEVEELEERLEAYIPTGSISDLLPGKGEQTEPQETGETEESEESEETEPEEDEDKKDDKKTP